MATLTPEELKRFDEASNHPYECGCALCKEWWAMVPPEEEAMTVTLPADLVEEIREFLEDYSDVVDGEDGPRPNKAMALLSRIEQEMRSDILLTK